jgi:hypothetical protein
MKPVLAETTDEVGDGRFRRLVLPRLYPRSSLKPRLGQWTSPRFPKRMRRKIALGSIANLGDARASNVHLFPVSAISLIRNDPPFPISKRLRAV